MTRIALQDAARWSQACSVARAAPGAIRRLGEAAAVTRRAAKALVHDESSRRQRRRLACATLRDRCKMAARCFGGWAEVVARARATHLLSGSRDVEPHHRGCRRQRHASRERRAQAPERADGGGDE